MQDGRSYTEVSLKVERPTLWSPESPSLYLMKIWLTEKGHCGMTWKLRRESGISASPDKGLYLMAGRGLFRRKLPSELALYWKCGARQPADS
ncbi:MAG: hypothetical protein ACLUOI_30430 [Eisenbergiella sp.]